MLRRSRVLYALLALLTITCGLLSRSKRIALPLFVAAYAGDTLWALMVFLFLCFLFPKRAARTVATAALVVSFAVELSQLYRAPWIDALRQTRVGALALGQGFLWSDLLCYAAGVALGVSLDRLISRVARSRIQAI